FDFLPIDLGQISGFATRFQLYTVPGQVYYNATRRLVLQGADGVVFVGDSQARQLDENIESLQNLQSNLLEHGVDVRAMPLVMQYNKQDLPPELGGRPDQLGGQVLVVVLHDQRHRAHVHAVLQQIALEILETLDVLVELPRLAVAHKDDAIGALQHEPAGGVVVDLARHRVELKSRREPRDLAEVDRQEIEEQRAVGLRRERDHAPAPRLRHASVDVMEIGRLAGPPRSVIDDFARDLAGREVDQGHAPPISQTAC